MKEKENATSFSLHDDSDVYVLETGGPWIIRKDFREVVWWRWGFEWKCEWGMEDVECWICLLFSINTRSVDQISAGLRTGIESKNEKKKKDFWSNEKRNRT